MIGGGVIGVGFVFGLLWGYGLIYLSISLILL